MILLLPESRSSLEPRQPVVALFGEGLIGSAVREQLLAHGGYRGVRLPFRWLAPEEHVPSLRSIAEAIANALRDPLVSSSGVAIVWCAGRCSFAATVDETRVEMEIFGRVVALAEQLARRHEGVAVAFHSVSSAGGLFEGRRLVQDIDDRCPARPYGVLKAEQEDRLGSSRGLRRRAIYRPSSVFGSIRPGQRMGLIPVMMLNGLHNRVTTITGSESTLRDYVWNQDVARYIAGQVCGPSSIGAIDEAAGTTVSMLCSGKPTSIFEVRNLIEWLLMKRLFVAFSSAPSNSAHITFSAGVLPRQWSPVDMAVAARAIHLDWVRTSGQLEPL